MQPEHHAHVVGAGAVDHAQRLAEAAALGQLDVDPVHHARPGAATSARVPHDSSAMMGSGERSRSSRRPSRSPVAERLLDELHAVLDAACGRAASACLAVQPVLASTRSHLVRAPRRGSCRRISSSRGVPTLILRIGKPRGLAHLLAHHLRLVDGDGEGGERGGGGVEPPELPDRDPRRLPTRSWSAAETAALAAGLWPTARVSAASMRSSAKGTSPPLQRLAQPRQERAPPVSAVSP